MIKNEYPPNIDEIRKFFTLKKGIVFSYYPDIYSPDNIILSSALIAHEIIHLAQQKEYGVEKWWIRYCEDKAFRLSQEIPAYQIQFKSIIIKDRNKRFNYAVELAKDLSGETYGNMINFNEALDAIKNEKIYQFKI